MELAIIVDAGTSDRDVCPVRVGVPELTEDVGVRLYEEPAGREVPCQTSPGELAWLVFGLERNRIRRYRLAIGGPPAAPAQDFGVQDRAGATLEFTVAGKLFTRYNYGPNWHRPFFHPVIGPGEKRVTRSWPMEEGYEGADESHDHPHHKGIWVAHGEVNGANDWADGASAGRIVHQAFERIATGPVFAEVNERLDWTDARGIRILTEQRGLTVYNLPDDRRLLDVTVGLTATDGPVKLGDTKEAGILSVRVASSMEGKRGAGLIENGFGATGEADTWGKTAAWCHYRGPVGDITQGIAVFDHPSNPRFPTNWHVRDYGLMSANCFGYHDFFPGTDRDGSMTIRAGETIRFRYRVYIHRGDAAAGKTADRWSDFASPPIAGVESIPPSALSHTG